jgi:hypothetical protein
VENLIVDLDAQQTRVKFHARRVDRTDRGVEDRTSHHKGWTRFPTIHRPYYYAYLDHHIRQQRHWGDGAT